MLSADHLFRLERYLDDQDTIDRSVIVKLTHILDAIYSLPAYQSWLNDASPYARQFELPSNFGADFEDSTKRLLDRYKLIDGSHLEVKVDKHDGRLHLTDGPWVPASYRVYPFTDESDVLCSYARRNGYDIKSDLLIDPACGCGHHGLALTNIRTRVYLDINIRALAFCRINSILNNTQQMLSGLNDIREGMPQLFAHLHCENALILINMPFAIFPKSGGLPLTLAQDGGDRGAALTFAALRAVQAFGEAANFVENIRLNILFYSLGKFRRNNWSWEVVERAKESFPNGQINFELLTNEKMWRVNGIKAEANPMPLERMKTKALCRQTYALVEEAEAISGYDKLDELYRKSGYTHLGYGILDINVKG